MKIDLNDESRKRRGRISIDPGERPPRVSIEGDDNDVFLDWDGSIDDSGNLRKCLACGNADLFRFRSLPSVTPILIILALAGFAVSLLGYANNPIILGLMAVVLLAECVILLVARTQLVCYRCRTTYGSTPIAPYHKAWDPNMAEIESNTVNGGADEQETAKHQAPEDERGDSAS